LIMFRTLMNFVINANQQPIDSFQTVQMIQAFKTVCKDVMQPGQATVFLVVDVASSLPVGYVKLYWEGYLTTGPNNAIITANFADYELKPFSIVDKTTVLPSNPTMTQNMMLVGAARNSRQQTEQVVDRLYELLMLKANSSRGKTSLGKGTMKSDLDPGSSS
jgi:hypothetical protein